MSIHVTVGPKPSNHPFYGKGSKQCYYIDGVPGATLNLTVGQSYRFTIDTPGHPFYFTTSEEGGSNDDNALSGFQPTEKGTVNFTVPESYPTTFYYQCGIHSYMGSYVRLEHNTFYMNTLLAGLTAPTSLTADEQNNIYVADQIGVVYKYNLTTDDVNVVLNIQDKIPKLNKNYDERGLLGLCLHPNFIHNGKFFVFYSGEGYNYLSEFNPDERIILRVKRTETYHNGGKIAFGPDGYLYLALGDGGPQGDLHNNAQNLNTWHGKILRISIDDHPYSIPADNPFINTPNALPEIWAYGFRNPWGTTFGKGMMIVTDSGYERGTGQEEVNIVVRGGNYGWNIKEGSKQRREGDISNMIDPIFAYTTGDEQFSDGGGSVIIGGAFTNEGDYICADYSGKLIRLRFNEKGAEVIETLSIGNKIRSIDRGGDRLYVLTSKQSGPTGTTGEVHTLTVV